MKGRSWPIGQGELNWAADQQRFWGELRGFVATYSSHYEFNVLLADGIQISLSGDLQTADKASIAVRLTARDSSDRWILETVDLNLLGQELAGTGCFSTKAVPLLQLQLEAGQLDLDVVQKLLPAGLLPQGPTAEGESPAAQFTEDTELPLLLAVALSARQLSWSGTTASGARLLIGAVPDCALIEDAASY